MTPVIELEGIRKLSNDLKKAAKSLSEQEVRYLVDTYYQIQEYRKATANQCRIMDESTEPHDVLSWFLGNAETLEGQIKKALEYYTDSHPVGMWLKGITGIGPIIAAGLLAHIDIHKAPTAGHIWSFAGLNPNQKWEKGQKRPWNARLKTLCWKIGESFVKVSNNPKDIYGKIYRQRKEKEIVNNSRLAFKDQAVEKLRTKKIGKDTEAYKWYSEGKLPPAHINERAKRYAVKIFLSHLQEFWYKQEFGVDPPAPYPIAILGHAHKI